MRVRKEAPGDDVSILALGSVFPLPQRLVSTFIDRMEEVRVVEGSYPAIGLQVKQKERIEGPASRKGPHARKAGASGAREVLFGLTVVRDELGTCIFHQHRPRHGEIRDGGRNTRRYRRGSLSPFGPACLRQHALQRVGLSPFDKDEREERTSLSISSGASASAAVFV